MSDEASSVPAAQKSGQSPVYGPPPVCLCTRSIHPRVAWPTLPCRSTYLRADPLATDPVSRSAGQLGDSHSDLCDSRGQLPRVSRVGASGCDSTSSARTRSVIDCETLAVALAAQMHPGQMYTARRRTHRLRARRRTEARGNVASLMQVG